MEGNGCVRMVSVFKPAAEEEEEAAAEEYSWAWLGVALFGRATCSRGAYRCDPPSYSEAISLDSSWKDTTNIWQSQSVTIL